MRKHILSIAVFSFVSFVGCQASVSVDPPSEVLSAFKRDHPHARETRVEKETQRNGDVHYEYHYTDSNGNRKTSEYDARGNSVSSGNSNR